MSVEHLKGVKYMHSEWKDRLIHWRNTLLKDLYIPMGEIAVEGFLTSEHLPYEQALRGDFRPMPAGTKWGKTWEYCWMRGTVTLPEEVRGQRICVSLKTGGETTVFVNGKSFGTYRAEWVYWPHHYISDNWLTDCAVPGASYDIVMEAYAGHYYPGSEFSECATGPVLPGDYTDPRIEGERAQVGDITWGVWNEDAYQLYMDVETLTQLLENIDQEGLRAEHIADALEKFTLIADFEQPLKDRAESYRAAREVLRPALEAHNGSTAPRFYAVGNSHLDLAWLWPMHETHRKTARTFAQQLRLLEEYPDYTYIQSQPAGYEMCRKHYPELYERIRQAIRDGRWIAEGAMWVEPDTNMTSGESLVRQVIHGKRYYKDVLGVDSVLLWLPDTFGYSAALPQILKNTGCKYLVTQKIFWSYNEGEQFPYHYFKWRGMDGSEIDTFLPTSYTYRTDPKEIVETWGKRVQKRGLDSFLLPFGYGDGGGGPSRDFLEFAKREKDLEGMPKVTMESPVRFFEDMEAQGGPKHTYVGELYFTAHRGVFTSQAAIKKGNRLCELKLRDAELWGALASLKGYAYPLARMDGVWKELLLNQFHDILPGSSIAKVYVEARQAHIDIQKAADAVCGEAVGALATENGIAVLNSLSFARTGIVRLPAEFSRGARTSGGEAVPVETRPDGVYALVTVPPMGTLTLLPEETEAAVRTAHAELTETGAVLENEYIRAVLNGKGEIVSFVSRESGREFAAGPMNHLLAYKDVPRFFDAWDIDSNYELQPIALDENVEMTLVRADGLEAVLHISRAVMNSRFEQDIVLAAGSRRVEFRTKVEWNELHRLLKVAFPIEVQCTEAINEVQFGYIARPNHRSRLYDSDRWEGCNQRYSALCDFSHGAAVLNDCKYGISNSGNELRLTLLRAAACPEMRADNGTHTFTYAITAWDGGFMDCDVTEQAYALNVPLRTAEAGMERDISAFAVDKRNIFIDTVKPAEDGSGDIVLRLYEAKRADTQCSLSLNVPHGRVWLTDMLENKQEELCVTNGQISLRFGTFEVKTLRVERA